MYSCKWLIKMLPQDFRKEINLKASTRSPPRAGFVISEARTYTYLVGVNLSNAQPAGAWRGFEFCKPIGVQNFIIFPIFKKSRRTVMAN
jgi:hypothetical protein